MLHCRAENPQLIRYNRVYRGSAYLLESILGTRTDLIHFPLHLQQGCNILHWPWHHLACWRKANSCAYVLKRISAIMCGDWLCAELDFSLTFILGDLPAFST